MQPLLLAASLFWVLSYALLTVRAFLDPVTPDELANIKRLVATLVGAIAFAVSATAVERYYRASPASAPVVLGCSAVASALLVFIVRLAMQAGLYEPDAIDFPEEFRWLLVWTGYFLASLMAWTTFRPLVDRSRIPALSGGIDTLAEPVSGGLADVWVDSQGLAVPVSLQSIDYVEAEGNYIRIHFDDRSGLLRSTLKGFAERLDQRSFVRIHRSVLCRRELIEGVRRGPSGSLLAVVRGGREVPVGRSYLSQLGMPGGRVPT